MPVYDYKCDNHGVFYGLQTMENHDKPQACPQCGQLSARIILIAPELLVMDKNQRQAITRNERAQFEPIISSAERRQQDHEHRQQCGCARDKNRSKLFYTAKGEKMFPSMRPWMISH